MKRHERICVFPSEKQRLETIRDEQYPEEPLGKVLSRLMNKYEGEAEAYVGDD